MHRLAELGAAAVTFPDDLVPDDRTRDATLERFQAALDRYAEALNVLSGYVLERGYSLRFALEPKPNEPRGDILLPTLGHEETAGLNFAHGISQALWHDKLFHVDLNGQHGPRFDQDLRFCAGNLRGAFWTVDALLGRATGRAYQGFVHFDYKPPRAEAIDGVWESARACMRNYLILREKAQAFRSDPEVVEALDRAKVAELRRPALEALDQLAMEHLVGVR